jgi:hypothetical protein
MGWTVWTQDGFCDVQWCGAALRKHGGVFSLIRSSLNPFDEVCEWSISTIQPNNRFGTDR